MGVRAAQGEATRRSIVSAAANLFVDRGYDRTSVDDIIARTNTSKGAVYHQFRDKRDIFDACFRASQVRIIEGMAGLVDPSLGPWERATHGIRVFLESYVADEEARTLLSMASGVLGVARAHQVDAEISLPFVSSVFDDLVDEQTELDVELAARILMAGICEAATTVVASDDPESVVERSVEVFTAFIRGLQSMLPVGRPTPRTEI